MGEKEAADREMRGRRIDGIRAAVAEDTTWTSRTDTVFDGSTGICYGRPKRAKGSDAQTLLAAMRSPCPSPALLLSSLQNFVSGFIEPEESRVTLCHFRGAA